MKKSLVSAAIMALALRLAMGVGAESVNYPEISGSSGGEALVNAVLGLEFGGNFTDDAVSEEIEEAAVSGGEQLMPEQEDVLGEGGANLGEEPGPAVKTVSFSAGVAIRNDTSFEPDIAAMAEQGPSIRLGGGEAEVLIIHTHGSEAYSPSPGDMYTESDPFRTEDTEHNVVHLGDILAEELEALGLGVIHDRNIYDYPSYSGSYSRSAAAVEDYMALYPGIKVVIDLHRDALGSGDTVYKTKAELNGETCAQVMLLVGSGEKGLYHPQWQENLKLGLYLQSAVERDYPSLARPLALKPERYNQQLCTGSLILEVGSTGNTMQEAERAVQLFADAAGRALLELREE